MIFKGNSTGIKHYDNFVVGMRYEVSRITKLYIDDNVHSDYDLAVCFRDSVYGCNLADVDTYFELLHEYRTKRIDDQLDL